MTSKLTMIAMAFALTAGCAAQEAPETEEGFALLQHDADTIEASVTEGAATLNVLLTEASPGVVDITFDFGDPVIAFSLDYNQGLGEFMPSGNALDVAQKRLVDQWLTGISAVIETDDKIQTKVEFASVRLASFVQIIPAGEALVAGSIESFRGWTHISSSCGNQYIGSGYYRECGKGCSCGNNGSNCAGRCGQGCGGTSSPPCTGSTVYTRDCAKHDYGLGSWWSASDDYMFASNNASCGGNCY